MSRPDRLDNLLEMHRESPDDPFLWFALAKEYEKHGLEKEAGEWYEKLVEHAPDEIGTYYHYGKFLSAKGSNVRAGQILHLGKAKALKMRDQKALSELVQLIQEIDDDD